VDTRAGNERRGITLFKVSILFLIGRGVDVLRDRYKDPLQASSVTGPHGAVSAIALTPPQPLICHISVTFIDQWLGMPL
jgi:hypothetical protein